MDIPRDTWVIVAASIAPFMGDVRGGSEGKQPSGDEEELISITLVDMKSLVKKVHNHAVTESHNGPITLSINTESLAYTGS